ncbi:hypothetical protein J7J45_06795 [Candidatus Aerophobetes bacterium]|nr:hypothetical protein [Candidatus Aerophobetes bacterium]
MNQIHQTDEIDEIDEIDRIYGLTGYPREPTSMKRGELTYFYFLLSFRTNLS